MLTEQEASDCQELLELINKKIAATTGEELTRQTFNTPLRKNINNTIRILHRDKYIDCIIEDNGTTWISTHTIKFVSVSDAGKQFLKDGGYLNKYTLQEKALERQRKIDELTELNIKLANSTLESNKQNRIDARENRIILIIGVILSAINILILILQ